MTTTRKTLLIVIAGLLVITSPCWALILYYVFAPAILERQNSIPFDPAGWKNAKDDIRYDMATDLRINDKLIGKSRLEVEKLLGKPTMIERAADQGPLPKFGRDIPVGELEYWYHVGHEKYRFAGMDSAFLVVTFQNENVVRVWLGGE